VRTGILPVGRAPTRERAVHSLDTYMSKQLRNRSVHDTHGRSFLLDRRWHADCKSPARLTGVGTSDPAKGCTKREAPCCGAHANDP
jgi:hypothetical protein